MKKILNNFLTDNEQKILLFLVFFAFLGLIIKYSGLLAEPNPQAVESLNLEKDYEIKYDLNTVSKQELITISGIGEKRAEDIIAYRSKNGFRSRKDLLNIKGIGIKRYSKMKDFFIEMSSETDIIESSEPEKEKDIILPIIININSAGIDELTKLKGIGPSKAEKIVALRNELGKFNSIDDLLKVKGIGPKTLEKFKKQITLGD